MTTLKSALLITCLITAAHAEGPAVPTTTKLWEGKPPGFLDAAPPESVTPSGGIANISEPGIAIHLPDKGKENGMALIVCPGGSYREVGRFADGMMTVPYFVSKGTAVFVLKYRTRPPNKEVESLALGDARRAVRYVRFHAREWGIDPRKIGLLGGSAGAHLVLNEATHADNGDPSAPDPIDRESCRPAFMGLLCPWPDKQPVEAFPIDQSTPPAFIASAQDDQVAPTAFAEGIAAALQKAGVPSELWILQSGGHTAFMQVMGEGSQWQSRFTAWLKKMGFDQDAR